MADADSTDIFMIFVVKDGEVVHGESTAELSFKGSPPKGLLNGFEPGAVFEISRFDFGVGVEQDTTENPENAALKAALAKVPGTKPTARPPRPRSEPGHTLDQSPVTVQPVRFTRQMDLASPELLRHMIRCTYFERVALVKRKSAGTLLAGEAYLRLDFKGVILTEANWTNDDPVEESYSFQARAITMRYRPQLPNGTLGVPVPGSWSMVPNAKEAWQ